MARATNLEKKNKKRRPEPQLRRMRKKVCYFCQERIDTIDWKEVGILRKYMSDRAKIRSRRVNGNCPRHQRQVSVAIKRAREMALLSYTGRS
ncbi:MAG TPA: 30S ribosomal protein S18 [Acidimicrobiia bacterium]|nr:30S ribosomal protein S18 [Acidimicrobiia bacterium]